MKGGVLMLWDRKSIHTIHCFGDSLTAGYGALPCEGWVEVLAKRHPKMGWLQRQSVRRAHRGYPGCA